MINVWWAGSVSLSPCLQKQNPVRVVKAATGSCSGNVKTRWYLITAETRNRDKCPPAATHNFLIVIPFSLHLVVTQIGTIFCFYYFSFYLRCLGPRTSVLLKTNTVVCRRWFRQCISFHPTVWNVLLDKENKLHFVYFLPSELHSMFCLHFSQV